MNVSITFEKRAGKYDLITIESGPYKQTLQNPKQGIIPHDMVHYVVESAFGLHGFIRLIGSGKTPEFVMGKSANAEAWYAEGLVEAFQAELWSGPTDDEHFLAMVNNIADSRGLPKFQMNSSELLKGRKLLLELSNQWKALPEGDRISVSLS